MKQIKYDKDFKKVMELLKTEYKWVHIEVLPNIFQGLINDVIRATKKLKGL